MRSQFARNLLHFIWGFCISTYQFTYLPFGLASAPRVIKRSYDSEVGFLQLKGVRCVTSSREQAALQCAAATQLLKYVGFLMYYSKSQIHPTSRLDLPGLYHRFRIDPPSTEAVRDTETSWEVAMSADYFSKRLSTVHLEAVSNSTSNPIHLAPLHYQGHQRLKHQAL